METQVADTGEIVAVAAEPVAVGNEQSHAEHSPDMVPVTALQAERRERQQLQEQNKLLQDHMSLMQANHQEAPKPDQYAGMSDDDVLTVGEAKKFLGNILHVRYSNSRYPLSTKTQGCNCQLHVKKSISQAGVED